ncbi:MAG: glycoside hydrolase family 3 N-terminal domain-containing protein [Flavisolibacter sp.]
MKKLTVILFGIFYFLVSFSHHNSKGNADAWVDSVFNSLSDNDKIAQLMVIRATNNVGWSEAPKVAELVTNYNVGGICFFKNVSPGSQPSGPVMQAQLTNYYQSIAKTPIMISIDGEQGVGMRLDSVMKFPYQLTLGAVDDEDLIYRMGKYVGEQAKRLGIHMNYAPVVDINNNPDNPVIGFRSFGQDKYKVAEFGVAYAKGMQDAGIIASAKHFPGHGDVAVDSHLDLPVINKSIEELDTLELYPFKELFRAGVGSVMIAHLYIPSIDNATNRATSLSAKNIKGLLRQQLGYDGLAVSDALEMKGVAKFFKGGEAAVEALIAGNDILCLPESVPEAIDAVKNAIKDKRLSWDEINSKVKRVLYAKYQVGLNKPQFVDTTNILIDLNAKVPQIRKQVAEDAITVIKNKGGLLPLGEESKVAYVGIGANGPNTISTRLQNEQHADVFNYDYADPKSKADEILEAVKNGKYEKVVVGLHNLSLRPANQYGISQTAMDLVNSLQPFNAITMVFGNVYAAEYFANAPTLVGMYEDDEWFQHAAVDFLEGSVRPQGTLPVSVAGVHYGSGAEVARFTPVGFSNEWLVIDSIVRDGLAKRAYPGAEVIAIQNGEIKYHKAFGRYEFDQRSAPVNLESIYDLASVTKVSATTVALMKLFEQGKIDINKTLGDYLPVAQHTDKANLKLRDILLHQAGLNPYISFYRETIDPASGDPSPAIYHPERDSEFSVPVARNVWLRKDWNDSMMKRIVTSRLGQHGKYVYSDNDFILLGKIVEQVTGMSLDEYVTRTFYRPLGMQTTGFKPWQRFGMERIVPTEEEGYFRKQLLQGYVHDEGAAMFGGVAGHAGLFSNAYDLSLLYQMLLNGGELNGRRYLKPETIKLFTAYGSPISRRGLGFDKPEKDNDSRKEPYPSEMASPESFGHTGFTGTCVWVDPKADLVYIFLSNRVYNTRNNNLLGKMNIRGKIQDAIYSALAKEHVQKTATAQKPAAADSKENTKL